MQALDLARLLNSLGIRAAILPPQLRPHLPLLRQHFSGNDESVVLQAWREAPALLESASSSSAMWVANAATVTPTVDAGDGRLHLTVANLFTNIHRRIEAEETCRTLKAIFAGVPDSMVHPPLSAAAGQRDEGAANHMRLSPSHGELGLHVFVYGADGRAQDPESARQTLSASRAVRQLHQIPDNQACFIRQNPDVIRQGVFHNDVIGVSNDYVLLSHESAYDHGTHSQDEIRSAYESLHPGKPLCLVTIADSQLSVEEAVHTYFFNSQIVTRPDGGMSLIAPIEVKDKYDGKALDVMERICASPDNPIDEVHLADLRQSMRNGGGPACLRLRVPMTSSQLAALSDSVNVLATEAMLDDLANVIDAFYPQQLYPTDIGNPDLLHCCRQVLGELGKVMRLPLLPQEE